MAFLNVPAVLSQVQAGQMRALAVANTTRIKALPDTPSMAEAGYPSVAMSTWYGISAPAGDPARDRRQAARRDRPDAQHAEDAGKDRIAGRRDLSEEPDEYAAYLQADAKLMLELIKAANMTAQ